MHITPIISAIDIRLIHASNAIMGCLPCEECHWEVSVNWTEMTPKHWIIPFRCLFSLGGHHKSRIERKESSSGDSSNGPIRSCFDSGIKAYYYILWYPGFRLFLISHVEQIFKHVLLRWSNHSWMLWGILLLRGYFSLHLSGWSNALQAVVLLLPASVVHCSVCYLGLCYA